MRKLSLLFLVFPIFLSAVQDLKASTQVMYSDDLSARVGLHRRSPSSSHIEPEDKLSRKEEAQMLYEKAMDYFLKWWGGDFKKAFAFLREVVERYPDHPVYYTKALYNLGLLYEYDLGETGQNLSEAARCYAVVYQHEKTEENLKCLAEKAYKRVVNKKANSIE